MRRFFCHKFDEDLNGIYQTTITLPAGPYTFSAYCRVFTAFTGSENTGAYIRVTDASGNTLAESERISAIDSDRGEARIHQAILAYAPDQIDSERFFHERE